MKLPGEVLIDAPLDFGFSLTGVIVWLAIVMVFSAIASFYPPWKASRLTTMPDMRLPGNEGAGGQQEGEFEVFAGAGGESVVPVYGTGEAAEGGFGGEVWVLTIKF